MSVEQIIEELRIRNVLCAVTDDDLKLKAKPGVITPALQKRLRANKREIIKLLLEQQQLGGVIEQEGLPLREVLRADGWSSEMGELIFWVLTADLPNKPFALHAGGEITDYKGFYRNLLGEINRGPNSENALNGNLEMRLKRLRKIVDELNKKNITSR